MSRIKKSSKCPLCLEKQPIGTIFQHIAECERDIKFTAKRLIKELEDELREQG